MMVMSLTLVASHSLVCGYRANSGYPPALDDGRHRRVRTLKPRPLAAQGDALLNRSGSRSRSRCCS
jgi:hypothetical protein